MGKFIHTPDNWIIINDTLVMPLAFFMTQEVTYSLVSLYTSHYYEQTVINYYSTGSIQVGDSIPWADGDTYISKIATYTAAYAIYQKSGGTLSGAKTYQKDLARTEANDYFNGNVQYGGTEYPAIQRGRLNSELYYFARIGSYDTNHYIYDKDGNQVNLAFYQMKEVLDLMDKLYFETNQNLDTHLDAIDALADITSVLAYDYTTGFPTLPYTG